MKLARLLVLVPLVAVPLSALAQSWAKPYDEGVKALRQGKFAEARAAFKQAGGMKFDSSAPIALPGTPTEPRFWRNGAPYSPNFLAAYALYRKSDSETQPEAKKADLTNAAAEFEALLRYNEDSAETYYFLQQIYQRLGDNDRLKSVQQRVALKDGKMSWRVDSAALRPEETASAAGNLETKGSPNTIRAGDMNPNTGLPLTGPTSVGRVNTIPSKFALIIGNSETKIGNPLTFATEDATQLHDVLVASAGYPEENVETVKNGTAAEMMEAAKKLAARVPSDATVMIYFSGNGVNVEGRDYMAGTDSAAGDVKSMVSKAELFGAFIAKGSHIFAFFQADRPIVDENFFGAEVPLVGSVSQVESTLPGEMVTPKTQNGRTLGTFTTAFIEVLQELRSNQIPIIEFGWQVFYKIRRGNTGTTGGGSSQTPTLPVLTNLAADARF